MIDIHCHILPELDDGPKRLDEALRMASQAVAEGVHTIIATPHHANGAFENDAATVLRSVRAFNQELSDRDIPLRVLPGQEVRVHAALLEELEGGSVIPLSSGRNLLLELPSARIPDHFHHLLHELQVIRITPIIAHPERNAVVMRQPEMLHRWAELGALHQVTAGSLTGLFGKAVRRLALRLCRQRLIDFVASDAHGPDMRPVGLRDAYELASREFGDDLVERWKDNARQLAEGGTIEASPPPVRQTRRRFFVWKL